MLIERPMVFLDLEATGISPYQDRIVEIAFLKRFPDGREDFFGSLINPQRPMPKESMAVHHITDEMVAQSPSFSQIAERAFLFLDNCDLGGFGIIKFDVPLLASEFSRSGFFFSTDGRRVVDALTIYHRMEPRNLEAAYRFYCGKTLDGAHRAEADTRAAAEVFRAQLARYEAVPKDLDDLSDWCRRHTGVRRSS
ncbi:MAG TPA: 3'-5' exonuclease [Elusimicrobiota bacterium]|nr:3'-5' exonuclease [Elusimicrobiota bacterium]